MRQAPSSILRVQGGDFAIKYTVIPIETGYWRPGADYVRVIASAVRDRLEDGDIVVISEKAISVARGNLIDESKVKPGILAKFLAYYWVRYFWGYFLGPICHFKPKLIQRFRTYPKEAVAHKQVALENASFLQALKPTSEGGIDVSNVPFTYASLPLKYPQQVTLEIFNAIRKLTKKKYGVMIADTDDTYSLCGLHLTSRPSQIRGIHSFGGVLVTILGRLFKLKRRATPLAIADCKLTIEEALDIAEFAHHARQHGAGRTAWDAAERFGVGLTEVTWQMLESVKHKPIVIVRRNQK